MSVIVKCKSCNGTGYVPMGNGVRGLLVCEACNGVGTYENDEITIINDEYYYKIPNGTSYVYETIPKEFKPYFDKLQQENKQLKEVIEEVRNRIKLLGKFDGEKCTRGFTMYTADFNNLLQILDKSKGE